MDACQGLGDVQGNQGGGKVNKIVKTVVEHLVAAVVGGAVVFMALWALLSD